MMIRSLQIAATGCGGLCLPATTGLLVNVGSFLGLGANAGNDIVMCGTLLPRVLTPD